MKKREELTETILMDWWLNKYHSTTCEGVVKKYPRLCKSPKWFTKYPVTQKQHDEWYSWMIDTIAKYYRISKKSARRLSWAIYLNCSPYVKDSKYKVKKVTNDILNKK